MNSSEFKYGIFPPTFIWSFVSASQQYTTNYVFDHMEVGLALALFQLSTIVSIFLGYRIFKEENITKKLIGSVIMVAGSVMIILLK